MAQVFQCRYAQGCIFYANKTICSTDLDGKYQFFLSVFPDVDLSKKDYVRNSKRLLEYFRKKKYKLVDRNDILNEFSPSKWNELSTIQKSFHSITKHCYACDPLPPQVINFYIYIYKTVSVC